MNKGSVKDSVTMANIAEGRAKIYDLLVGIFGRLPDQQLLSNMKGVGFQRVLNGLCGLDNPKCQSGTDHVASYQAEIKGKPEEQILNELSVDRTRILRGTGHRDLKPPYEGLYRSKEGIGESVLQVKRFYRKSGLLPDDTVRESPDYLFVELDFMKNLCCREKDQWASGSDATETLINEISFLEDHLGRWVGDFCRQAEEEAMTDFYKGFLMILDAVVAIDMEYLKNDFVGIFKV